jgi:hypothetical protein
VNKAVRRYKLTIFDLYARHPAAQTRTEIVEAYSAEDAVYQFKLRNEGAFTQPPTVDRVEPA